MRPAGTIETDNESISLRVSGSFETEQDIADVNLPSTAAFLRLSDIATVRRGFADPPQPMFRINGQPGIGIAISMREGGDILALGENIKKVMASATAELPLGIEPFLVADQAVVVESAHRRVHVLPVAGGRYHPGCELHQPGRSSRPRDRAGHVRSLWRSSFPSWKLASIDMQRISLGALIIALALLVDDAMTTTDAMLTRLGQGDDKVPRRFSHTGPMPMRCWLAPFVTISGFVPVGFAASSAGEYTFTLFAVVAIALVVSWFVAVLFAPLLGVLLLQPPKADAGGLAWSSGFPGLPVLGHPPALADDRPYARDVRLVGNGDAAHPAPVLPEFRPAGAARRHQPAAEFVDLCSEDAAKRFDAILKDNEDVERWSTYVGRGAIRFYLPLDVQLPNDFFTQAVIVAKDVEARERLQQKLEAVLPVEFPNAISRVSPLELGPPVGWPVQYRVSGPDVSEVREIALKLAQVLAANPNTDNISFDWLEPSRQVRIRIDQDEARLLGLSSQAVARILNTVYPACR